MRGRRPSPAYERVMAKVRAEGDCLVFTGFRLPKGYGTILANTVKVGAHRVVWEHHHGPIPEGLLVRHSCDNPPCVNIEHLLIGTHQDNMDDKVARGRAVPRRGVDHHNAIKTQCKNGHPFSEANTRTYRGKRFCRECDRNRDRARRA